MQDTPDAATPDPVDREALAPLVALLASFALAAIVLLGPS